MLSMDSLITVHSLLRGLGPCNLGTAACVVIMKGWLWWALASNAHGMLPHIACSNRSCCAGTLFCNSVSSAWNLPAAVAAVLGDQDQQHASTGCCDAADGDADGFVDVPAEEHPLQCSLLLPGNTGNTATLAAAASAGSASGAGVSLVAAPCMHVGQLIIHPKTTSTAGAAVVRVAYKHLWFGVKGTAAVCIELVTQWQ